MTIAVMLAAFIFRVPSWRRRRRESGRVRTNRVNTRPKQGRNATLPIGYADRIREMAGVRHAAAPLMTAPRLPGKDKVSFASRATEMAPYLAMVDELDPPVEQKQAFLADERSALVTQTLATEQGWKLGDRVVESRAMPGQWEVTIAGICRSLREGFAERQVWLHYAAIGLSLSYPSFENLVSHALQDRMSFPPIVLHRRVAWLAVALGVGLSVLAAALPVYRAAMRA